MNLPIFSNYDIGPWLREMAHEESEAPDAIPRSPIWPADRFECEVEPEECIFLKPQAA